jgi:hypothetical protein
MLIDREKMLVLTFRKTRWRVGFERPPGLKLKGTSVAQDHPALSRSVLTKL